jgi:hypothetical protein
MYWTNECQREEHDNAIAKYKWEIEHRDEHQEDEEK